MNTESFKSTLLTLLFVGLCFSLKAQEYKIQFEVVGLQDSVVYIGHYLGEKKYVDDTVEVVDGRFVTMGDESLSPGLYFVYSPTFYREFIFNEPFFSFKSPLKGGYESVEFSGSEENTIFKNFQIEMGAIQRQLLNKQKALDSLSAQDSLEVLASIRKLQEESVAYRNRVIRENKDLFIADFLSLMNDVQVPSMDSIADRQERKVAQYQYYKDHYFDNVDLSTPGLVRTPIVKSKVINYFDKVITQSPDTIIYELDKLLNKVAADPESLRFWTVTFFTKYQESSIMGHDEVVVHMIENYYLNGKADWIGDETKEKLKEELVFMKPNLIGNYAPPLVLQDTSLNTISVFNRLKSPYLVLFFYDPDCGHCKKKAPVLREAYDDLKKLNAEVVAVSTTTDISKWKKFIKDKDFDVVVNAADTDYKSNFRADYNVRTTPQVYVVDEDRKIIAKKLDVDQLVDFLTEYQKYE